MRTKKAALNFIYDAFPQIVISLIGFFRIKLMLDVMGNDTLGIYQLFGQLLAYVSFAELGFSNAISFSLYKPIQKKDHRKMNGILSASKFVFNIIFLVMLCAGLILTFNIGFFIKETTLAMPFIEFCFFLMLISNILTYLVAPHTILFDSEQNKYMYAKHTQFLMMIKALSELVVIVVFKSLVVMLLVDIAFSLLQNILIIYLSKKQHKWIDLKQKKNFEFWKKTKEFIPHKIGSLIAYNIDVIIISKVLGLTEVVAYSSYMYIINTLVNIISKISNASLPGIGNLLITDSDKAYKSFLEYNSFVFYLATIICVPLYCVISQFVAICYGTQYVLSNFTVILLIFIVFYSIIRNVLLTFTNAKGLFKETLVCVYLEIAINLSLSLILVNYLGISGVILATAIAYIVSEFLLKPSILNKNIFHSNISKYYLNCFKYVLYVVPASYLFHLIVSQFAISNLLTWFICGLVIFITNFALVSCYYYFVLHETDFFERIKKLLGRGKNEI